jgi:hypothetical protein
LNGKNVLNGGFWRVCAEKIRSNRSEIKELQSFRPSGAKEEIKIPEEFDHFFNQLLGSLASFPSKKEQL